MDIVIINEKLDKPKIIALEKTILNYFRANNIANLAKTQSFQKPVKIGFKEPLDENQKIAISKIIQKEGLEVSFDVVPDKKAG